MNIITTICKSKTSVVVDEAGWVLVPRRDFLTRSEQIHRITCSDWVRIVKIIWVSPVFKILRCKIDSV